MSKKPKQKNNIQNSFDLTLTNSNLQNLNIDIAELTIDSVLNDGLLKDIPIVGTIANLSKFGANIHDRLFLKKILSFLNQLKDIPVDKRKKMIGNIDYSKKYRIKVGEKLLYIIDSCDDYEISELISVVFRVYIEEKITYDEFLKTASVLKNLNIDDFKWFIKEKKYHYFNLDDIGGLVGSGLFELHYEEVNVEVSNRINPITREHDSKKFETDVDGGVSVSLSRVGKIILEIFCPSYKKPKTIKL